MKLLYVMFSSRKWARRLFQTRGPATAKLLSPNVLCVCGTAHDLSVEERSRRRGPLETKHMTSARYGGAWPDKDKIRDSKFMALSYAQWRRSRGNGGSISRVLNPGWIIPPLSGAGCSLPKNPTPAFGPSGLAPPIPIIPPLSNNRRHCIRCVTGGL